MANPIELLAAYDTQLRGDKETPGAVAVVRRGPLHLVTFAGGRGLITYQDLGTADHDTIEALVSQALGHFEAIPDITSVEWKTRGHDHAPHLHGVLVEHGFTPDDPESIMLGQAHLIAVDVILPAEVALRMVTSDADVRAMCAMQGEVFGDPLSDDTANALIYRLSVNDGLQLWVAEAAGQIISAGRLEPVPGTSFAGIWGGATRQEWRSRGIYRALTSARARAALEIGKTLIHSDSTEYSRPILERAGMIKVSTTTPYIWSR